MLPQVACDASLFCVWISRLHELSGFHNQLNLIDDRFALEILPS